MQFKIGDLVVDPAFGMGHIVETLIAKVVLFSLILIVGTMAMLVAGETKSLALTDLSATSVQAMTPTAKDEMLYAGATRVARPWRASIAAMTIEAAAVILPLDLRSLANPTIIQVLSLTLTLTLAGLVLVLIGQREWVVVRAEI